MMEESDKQKSLKIREIESRRTKELYVKMMSDDGATPDFKHQLQLLEKSLGDQYPGLFAPKNKPNTLRPRATIFRMADLKIKRTFAAMGIPDLDKPLVHKNVVLKKEE